MNNQKFTFLSISFLQVLLCGLSAAQEHSAHGNASTKKVDPPKIFLDKSENVVQYQLNRLTNAQLLLIKVATDHAKYTPVFAAIATRPAMSADQREKAVQALVTLRNKSTFEVVFELLAKLKDSDREQRQSARDLTALLLRHMPDRRTMSVLEEAASSENPLVCQAAMATLIHSDNTLAAEKIAATADAARIGLLVAITLVPDEAKRENLRAYVIGSLHSSAPKPVRHQAAMSLPSVGGEPHENFAALANLIAEPGMEEVAVQSLLRVNTAKIEGALARQVTTQLMLTAEATPAAKRTTDNFIDAAQLLERLLPRLTEAESKSIRKRMQELAVRVVRIKTIAEEMRYDLKHFVAAAGKPIQVILQNEDLMPHNLVVVRPGTLKEVALQAATMAPDAMTDGKQYVPAVPQVLISTKMVQSGKQERLTFTAPAAPGEYPFVCTYPNHWMRMYGVMVVVEDVDAFLQNPVEPKDPIGNNRSFVKNWKLGDFEGHLENGLRGRNSEIGARIFTEAACAQCHVLDGQGGRVGPELAEVYKRNEGDSLAVLREILEPSHKIDTKYASHSVLTLDGQVYAGVIVAEDEKTVSLINSPDQIKPTVIQRKEIDEMVQSSKSVMPTALMDQFTQDEVLELLAYIKALQVGR